MIIEDDKEGPLTEENLPEIPEDKECLPVIENHSEVPYHDDGDMCIISDKMVAMMMRKLGKNGKVEEEKAIIDYLREHYIPKRLTLLIYLVSPRNPQYKTFPVNMLRNLAIRNVRTSHYMIMDMDMWPTRSDVDER